MQEEDPINNVASLTSAFYVASQEISILTMHSSAIGVLEMHIEAVKQRSLYLSKVVPVGGEEFCLAHLVVYFHKPCAWWWLLTHHRTDRLPTGPAAHHRLAFVGSW